MCDCLMNTMIMMISSSMHLDKPGWIDRHFLCFNDKKPAPSDKKYQVIKTVEMEKSSAYDPTRTITITARNLVEIHH